MILLSALSLASSTFAQTWIWYPGDYEIWLGNQMNNRRTERGAFFPPFWKTDSHYVVDKFNPQVAARLARALENWRRYEPTLSNLMYKALKYVSEEKNLSPNVREIIEHALTEPV